MALLCGNPGDAREVVDAEPQRARPGVLDVVDHDPQLHELELLALAHHLGHHVEPRPDRQRAEPGRR